MTRSKAEKKISNARSSANTTGEELFVTGEPNSDTRVVFRTNSKSYLDSLIPERYRSNSDCESTKPTFTIELRDRSYIAYRVKTTQWDIILDINDLEKISCLWWMVIPTLHGDPDLDTSVNHASAVLRPALERIIQNCGHMSYYSLHGILDGCPEDEYDDNDTDDRILDDSPRRCIVCRLGNDYLKPPTRISRVINLESEKNGIVEGPWLPEQRDEAITRFLAKVIDWTKAPHNQYEGGKFEKKEMKDNLLWLNDELKWFQDRKKKRKTEDEERGKKIIIQERQNRRGKNKRLLWGEMKYGGEKENTAEEENTAGKKKIRRSNRNQRLQ